ncbi:hypothetical protein LTR53_011204 [Teratosphaeriaceae sp. CCFEE 6253]|nr:hypothetical protein LTR53_011204 [Teratosphaeriaceae sp. CCFEE 6253]
MSTIKLPSQGDWLVVPLAQENTVELEWWTKKTLQRSTYYLDKCYFGTPNKVSGSGRMDFGQGFGQAPGEAIIFIAKELLDERTSGLPHLKPCHILDRLEGADKDKSIGIQGREELGLSQDRQQVPLRSGRRGSQDEDTVARVSPGPQQPEDVSGLCLIPIAQPPSLSLRPKQHRFSENSAKKIANIGVDMAGDLPDDYGGKYIARALGGLLKFLSATSGHPLRQFGDDSTKLDAQGSTAMSLASLATLVDDVDWPDDLDVALENHIHMPKATTVTGGRQRPGISSLADHQGETKIMPVSGGSLVRPSVGTQPVTAHK